MIGPAAEEDDSPFLGCLDRDGISLTSISPGRVMGIDIDRNRLPS